MWAKPTITPPASSPPNNNPMDQLVSPTRTKNPGRRFAQIVKLKPEFVDKYKEAHAAVWPEVLKQIKDCNIQDCMLPLPRSNISVYPFPSRPHAPLLPNASHSF